MGGFGARELYISVIYASFFAFGCVAPFIFALGYVWVDVFYPQALSDTLASFPDAALIGIAAFFGYFTADRKFPHISTHTVLTLLIAIWVTTTLLWAEVPVFALAKWNWAFKTVLFSLFIPFFFRSRVQIEAFLLVFFFAAMAYVFPVAVKTALTGGGYGQNTGLVNNNSGLAESSTLSAVACGLIPLALYARQYSILLPRSKLRDLGCIGFAFICVLGAIGTYARTSVIGMSLLAVDLFVRTRQKVLFLFIAALMAGVGAYVVGAKWDQRISTIATYEEENSAYTRILVWTWTLGYVATHPLGGGFATSMISRIQYEPAPGQMTGEVVVGRAFHSSYFELLGEQGFPGLALFVGLIVTSLLSTSRIRRTCRGVAELEWAFHLAAALRLSLVAMLACGAFVGIAFQPLFWYFFAIIESLRFHVRMSTGASGPHSPMVRPAYQNADRLMPVGRVATFRGAARTDLTGNPT